MTPVVVKMWLVNQTRINPLYLRIHVGDAQHCGEHFWLLVEILSLAASSVCVVLSCVACPAACCCACGAVLVCSSRASFRPTFL
jgi:hypothetical protein